MRIKCLHCGKVLELVDNGRVCCDCENETTLHSKDGKSFNIKGNTISYIAILDSNENIKNGTRYDFID